ncbi:hypothetical protein [Zobellia laminariae]|uniref:hypothetical protein n=1 Tax=Zobellia laminariae TaxID=248906 RepID=UPI0026F478AC|nr:hypothetical protein [Zobellia laminariae]WKX75061.1 hypothetical protein Q5W13_15080 [Zobellia laminariae]
MQSINAQTIINFGDLEIFTDAQMGFHFSLENDGLFNGSLALQGFIAQELKKALKNNGAENNGIISEDAEGMLSVRYNDLIAPMVKAIQEQTEEIKLLKEEKEATNKRLEVLEQTILELQNN